MEAAMHGVLCRPQSLHIRPITYKIRRHLLRDAGVFRFGAEFLRPEMPHFQYALVAFDRDGCGQNARRDVIEARVERQLNHMGWAGRAAAVVIEPELEAWVWSNSPIVDDVLGWRGQNPSLRNSLAAHGFELGNDGKPENPKGAMEFARKHAHLPRSSALFRQLATRVSLTRCVDPSFSKLKAVLYEWFG
jgi:hypothetical protein